MNTKIIKLLNNSETYLSGEEISRSMKLSRTAVWKQVQDLRDNGYQIDAVPHLGYKLTSIPDRLFPLEVQAELENKIIGKNIVYFDQVSSTMDEAFRLGMEGAIEGTVVISESQSSGRGRIGRSWSSPKYKGIYCSVILRPKLSIMETSKLTLMSAVALCKALQNTTQVQAAIKWPNDILVGGLKLAGILTELNAEVDQVKFVVIGFGINVNNSPSQLVEGATSLKILKGGAVARLQIVQAVLTSLDEWYLKFINEGFVPIKDAWVGNSLTLDQRLKFREPDGALSEGVAVGLDVDGGLLLKLDTNEVIKKMAGDVILSGQN